MTLLEDEKPFVAPRSRPRYETWYAAYQLSRNSFLTAVEHAIAHVPHPVKGLRWEYEGFRGDRLYIWQPGDLERGFIPTRLEFRMHIEDGQITLKFSSDVEIELLLFRRLATELDNIEYVSQARVIPCTLLTQQPQECWNLQPSRAFPKTEGQSA